MERKLWISAIALTALLASGCGSQPAANPTASSKPDAASSAKQAGQRSPRPSINPNQRTMMMTFQSLLAMDKADGLAITKEEATQLLPIVQASISQGELSADDQNKINAALSDAQKKYLTDNASQMQQRFAGGQGRGQGGQNAPGSQGGKGTTGGQALRQGFTNPDKVGNPGANADNSQTNGQAGRAGNRGNRANGGNGGNGANAGNGANPGNAGGGGGGQGRFNAGNIGQQLVDLLQSKTQ